MKSKYSDKTMRSPLESFGQYLFICKQSHSLGSELIPAINVQTKKYDSDQ